MSDMALKMALFESWEVNCFEDYVESMANWLEGVEKETRVYLKDWADATPYDVVDMEEVPMSFYDNVWNLLVIMFGDYFAHPRNGWLNYPEDAAEFLRDGMEMTWLSES